MPRRPTSPPSTRNRLRDRLDALDDEGDAPPLGLAWRAELKPADATLSPDEQHARAYWFDADTEATST